VRQEIGVDALAEQLAVRADPADRDAAEVHAVIALSRPIRRVFVPLPFARQ
jgi:hypothetical protein